MTNSETATWSIEEQKKYLELGYWHKLSIGAELNNWCKCYSNNIAIISGNKKLTYQQLNQQVELLAAGFYHLKVRPNDRVLLQLPNCIGFIISFFALIRLGALPILAMPSQRQQDIHALCKLAEPKLYIVPNRFLGTHYQPLIDDITTHFTNTRVINIDNEQDPDFTLSQYYHSTPFTVSEPHYLDPAILLLSGGTTGTPKLIPRTHADYCYNARAMAEICKIDSNSIYLNVLPIAHNFSLSCPGLLGVLSKGGCVVLSKTTSFDEGFNLIKQHKVTITALVPPLAQLWANAREWDDTDITSLKLIQIGGSRLEASIAKQIKQAMHCQLQQVFGTAEGLICCTRLDDSDEVIFNTQGRPISPHDQVLIVDENDQPLTIGATGEMITKGPYTIHGYYRATEQNKISFTKDNYYRMGDLVKFTSTGNVIVEGRIKEQINRAGEKIAAAEIEQKLIEYPSIESCAVVPVKDSRLGERSCAFIISSNKQITLSDVRNFLKQQGIAFYKLPDQLEHLTKWPLTSVGKIDKRSLSIIGEQQMINNQQQTYFEQLISINNQPLDLAVALINEKLNEQYAVYEHNGEWSVGLGNIAQLTVSADKAIICYNQQQQYWDQAEIIDNINAALASLPIADWRAYGASKFELAHIFHDPDYISNNDETLLQLFIPSQEVRFTHNQALLRSITEEGLQQLHAVVTKLDQLNHTDPKINNTFKENEAIIRSTNAELYKEKVAIAVNEIKAGQYQKIILSRKVPIPADIDLVASYQLGRKHNTPARSFVLNFNDLKLIGFSPETVLEVNKERIVSTQPLAGTRALKQDDPEQSAKLYDELINDTKEIAEHAVSVKLAFEELERVCEKHSVVIPQFMTVSKRGTVQHLASRVTGKLKPELTSWHAFKSLFPAVTASGIPKREALAAIRHHEANKRGAYSGSVMIVDSNGSLDAALVLRSLYQQNGQVWLQAGAGIIDQSLPERELEETIEKLSCISRYLVVREQQPVTGMEG